jgi:type I restriction enzyme, R subunit
MKDSSTEADARIIIDDLLRQANWDPTDKSQVVTEVTIKSQAISDTEAAYDIDPSVKTDDGDEIPTGRADYVLLDQRSRPLAIIEAKKNAIQPYTAKQQALPYAKSIGAPFIFLTNGELIYFWDYTNDDARIVNSFYSRRDMERLVHMRKNIVPLATIPIPDDYLRNGEAREVRPYQKDAMRALDHSIELGKKRFLIELPTGTGKTDLTCLYLERLMKAGRAERILFLVDREQLAKQAIGAIQDILVQYSSYWLKPGQIKQEKQITVCLLQTMINRYPEFTSGYFDVVITDESHRSIYGTWQTALTHFDAFHIGLTATPAEYIERNTLKFYNCKPGKPDFSYAIQDAFNNNYLTPYKFAAGITEILSEGADLDNEHYDPAEFERKWTNEKSNRLMMEEFDKLAHQNYKELAPGQSTAPGKTIVFAINKHHAARLTKYLNELHPEHKGRYAEVITSDVSDADGVIRKFKKEKLPQVAVSVGMLDTGFDCPEVLNLVMARRVRSPILYQQMRGRGTRTAPKIKKEKFVIYDFFGNHKYFNDSDTDIFTSRGGGHASVSSTKQSHKPQQELIELGLEDHWLESVHYVEVGPEGERIDKKDYVSNWEVTIKAQADDPIIKKVRNDEPLNDEEEQALEKKLNQPEHYFNEDNLRNAYKNPVGNIVDFIKAALGIIKVRSKEEILNENFHAWLVTKGLTPEQSQYLSMMKNRGIAQGKITITDLFSPPLSILNAGQVGVELFGEQGLGSVIKEMDESVFEPKRSKTA